MKDHLTDVLYVFIQTKVEDKKKFFHVDPKLILAV